MNIRSATPADAQSLAELIASFQPTLTLTGSDGSTNLTADFVTALAAQPNLAAVSNAPLYVFGGGFIGSIASRTDNPNPPPDQPAILLTLVTNIAGTDYYAVYQESKHDSATFSFHRDPYANGPLPFNGNLLDTVFRVQAGSDWELIGGTEQVPTNLQYRMISTLGGYVFPAESVPWTTNSPRQGEFVLQSGRVEE